MPNRNHDNQARPNGGDRPATDQPTHRPAAPRPATDQPTHRPATHRPASDQPTHRPATHPIVDLDVAWVVPADLDAVDALARLQVAAARRGWWVQFHHADAGLGELLERLGLAGVLHLCPCCQGLAAPAPAQPDES